jgi:hypothetical protein
MSGQGKGLMGTVPAGQITMTPHQQAVINSATSQAAFKKSWQPPAEPRRSGRPPAPNPIYAQPGNPPSGTRKNRRANRKSRKQSRRANRKTRRH